MDDISITEESGAALSENGAQPSHDSSAETETAKASAAEIPEGEERGEGASGEAELSLEDDLGELSERFPELRDTESIKDIFKYDRYEELRLLGLSSEEAYLAVSRRPPRQDNRSHLSSSIGRGAASPAVLMSSTELADARELFGGLSDAEIRRLYKRVNS